MLDINSVQLSFAIDGDDLSFTTPGYEGHLYQLQTDMSRKLAGPRQNVGAPATATGSPIRFDIDQGASISPAFFRIHVDP